MSLEVMSSAASDLEELFALREEPDRRMKLAAFDGEVITVPAQVRLAQRRLDVEVFGGTFVLDVCGLSATRFVANGFATLSVPDRDHGRRVLDGMAHLLEADIAPPRSTLGALETIEVALMAVPANGGVALQIKTEPMRFGLWISADKRSSELVLAVPELEPGFLAFAELWADAFCDGKMPRRTRTESPFLASEAPWITTTTPLVGADDVVWSDVAFGGETLFAPADRNAETVLLAWADFSAPPRELLRVERGRLSLYPSPDGQWVAVEAPCADSRGSLTHGTSEIRLISVRDGDVWSLCRSPSAIRFGTMSGIIAWSRDSQRFSLTCNRGKASIALVYDVEARAFIDASEMDAIANRWFGGDLQLRRTDYEFFPDGRWVATFNDFRWTPGIGTLTSSEPPPLRSADEYHEIYYVDDGLEIGLAECERRVIPIENPESFDIPWANTMLVDLNGDARVFDAASGTWRYLAERNLGKPRWLAPAGRVVVFFDGARMTVGIARELPPVSAPAIEWTEPDLRRVAIASALANDVDQVDVALRRMDDVAYQETRPLVDEIVDEHGG
jgi:hypothetical protein